MFFSIIIATRNRAHLLSRALESVRGQTCRDFELIVVDDGGDDDSRAVLESFDEPRFAYFWKPHGERNLARNFGIERSRGDYICFLDSDDYYYSNHLQIAEELISSASSPPIVHLGYEIVDTTGYALERFVFPQRTCVKSLLAEKNCLSMNAIFVRRDVIEKHMFIPSATLVHGEDYCLWLILSSRYRFVFSPHISSAVVSHSSRSVNRQDAANFFKSAQEFVSVLRADKVFTTSYGPTAKRILCNRYLQAALKLAEQKAPATQVMTALRHAVSLRATSILSRRFLAVLTCSFRTRLDELWSELKRR